MLTQNNFALYFDRNNKMRNFFFLAEITIFIIFFHSY